VVGVAPDVNPSDVYAWGACDDNGFCSTQEIITGINAARGLTAEGEAPVTAAFSAVHGPLPVGSAEEDGREPPRQLRGDVPQLHALA